MNENTISLGFLNIAAWFNGARYNAAGSTQFFWSKTPNAVYNNPDTDIWPMVKPFLKDWLDTLSFSEVFGLRQKEELTRMLERYGYTVYATDAFEMWSQSVKWEHLYNVVGIREDRIWSPITVKHQGFRSERYLSGIAISARYLLSDATWEWERTKVRQARHLYSRLASGILDGAISIFEFEKSTLATWHVHRFNSKVRDFIQWNISEKPFVLLGDMNVPHGKKILTEPPFNTIDWKNLVHAEERTFGFVDWLDLKDRITLFTAHMQPDVLIVKGIVGAMVRFYQTPSDHNGIWATLTLQENKTTSQASR